MDCHAEFLLRWPTDMLVLPRCTNIDKLGPFVKGKIK